MASQGASGRPVGYEGSFIFNQVLQNIDKEGAVMDDTNLVGSVSGTAILCNFDGATGMHKPLYQYDINTMYAYINSSEFTQGGVNYHLNMGLSNK